jgi:hypothetical protein
VRRSRHTRHFASVPGFLASGRAEYLIHPVRVVVPVDETVALVQPAGGAAPIDGQQERSLVAVRGHDVPEHLAVRATPLESGIEVEVFDPRSIGLGSNRDTTRDLRVGPRRRTQ